MLNLRKSYELERNRRRFSFPERTEKGDAIVLETFLPPPRREDVEGIRRVEMGFGTAVSFSPVDDFDFFSASQNVFGAVAYFLDDGSPSLSCPLVKQSGTKLSPLFLFQPLVEINFVCFCHFLANNNKDPADG